MKVFGFLLFCLLAIFFSKTEAQWKTQVLDSSVDFTLSWLVSAKQINISLHINQNSWMSVGFHPYYSLYTGMTDADIYSAEWNTTSNSPMVHDRYSKGESIPPLDTDIGCPNNVLSGSVSGTQSGGSTTIQFSRLLSTGDGSCDVDISGYQLVIWARGNNQETFGFHEHNRGSLRLKLV